MDSKFITIETATADVREIMKLLSGGVAPRPIALVSTISNDGINNLAPFSYFNTFSANPPIVGFSVVRRVRNNSSKDTLNNLQKTGECVVHAVSHAMVQQTSLASTEYPPDVDEFTKAGFTSVNADLIKPRRVLESPFQMECRVAQIVTLGTAGGAGNLILCEVLKFHVAETVLKDGIIEPDLIDLVGRNSANFYTRAAGAAIFEIAKPVANMGIGIENLPAFIRNSNILSANNLGQLGNIEALPKHDDILQFVKHARSNTEAGDPSVSEYSAMFKDALNLARGDKLKAIEQIETAARKALEFNQTQFAIHALMAIETI